MIKIFMPYICSPNGKVMTELGCFYNYDNAKARLNMFPRSGSDGPWGIKEYVVEDLEVDVSCEIIRKVVMSESTSSERS